MIQRYTLGRHSPYTNVQMIPDERGHSVRYDDAKAALLGATDSIVATLVEDAVRRQGIKTPLDAPDLYGYVRSILGDEAVDEFIAQKSQRRAVETVAENKPT